MTNFDSNPVNEKIERMTEVANRLKGCEERNFFILDFNELLRDTLILFYRPNFNTVSELECAETAIDSCFYGTPPRTAHKSLI